MQVLLARREEPGAEPGGGFRKELPGVWGGPAAAYLQHSDLLPVAKQPEGQRVFGVQSRDHLTATQRDGDDVGLQIGPVLVEDELVVLHAAPPLPPAVVGQHVEVACRKTTRTVGSRGR